MQIIQKNFPMHVPQDTGAGLTNEECGASVALQQIKLDTQGLFEYGVAFPYKELCKVDPLGYQLRPVNGVTLHQIRMYSRKKYTHYRIYTTVAEDGYFDKQDVQSKMPGIIWLIHRGHAYIVTDKHNNPELYPQDCPCRLCLKPNLLVRGLLATVITAKTYQANVIGLRIRGHKLTRPSFKSSSKKINI